ncbi:helix-turn-helix domain-containing protein [Sporosalibacterium faouarense]|uniref:helix-turn-helix domain-containing protein n=1 Tax=Sporosalibacterium faouarense TaxID=516123 RepID=UPI00192C441A|nr:helix-turn-helix transcriptional regulator [Sporosalibacterium faouarense]
MNFSERLRILRTEQSLKQEELAKILNISRQSVSNYENGARFPSDELLLHRISSYFNVSLDYLLGATNIRNYFNNKLDNSKIREDTSLYSLDKIEALENLFEVVDNMPAHRINQITSAIKIFVYDDKEDKVKKQR